MPDGPTIVDVLERLDSLLERVAVAPAWGRWLDLETAERYCGLSVRSLRRLIASGTLTPHRVV